MITNDEVRLSSCMEPQLALRESTAADEAVMSCGFEVATGLRSSARNSRTTSILPLRAPENENGDQSVIWYAPPQQISFWGKPIDSHVEVSGANGLD